MIRSLFLLCLMFLVSACSNQLPQQVASTTTAPQVSSTSVVELGADWQSYSDSVLGFSINHPPGWEICTTTEHSRLFCITQPGSVGFPVFYVTAIPPSFKNEDASAYNFVAEDTVQAFAKLQVGGVLTTGDPNPDFSKFTRLPDFEVNSETSLVVENMRIWEAGPNTKDRRVFVQHGNDLYMIGTYYETPMELETFQAVLASFKFE